MLSYITLYYTIRILENIRFMIFINLITVNDAKYIINICILELMYIYRVSDNFASEVGR